MSLLYRKAKDRMLLKLIRRYLQSDIMTSGLSQQRDKGTPQGSPLSPLLSNIILNELDNELDKRGLRFVRYAGARPGMIAVSSLKANVQHVV